MKSLKTAGEGREQVREGERERRVAGSTVRERSPLAAAPRAHAGRRPFLPVAASRAG